MGNSRVMMGHRGQSACTHVPKSHHESKENDNYLKISDITHQSAHARTRMHVSSVCYHGNTDQFVLVIDIENDCPNAMVTANLHEVSQRIMSTRHTT